MTEGMLLELLPQLKARAIINSHPQLTYSLIKTMVTLGLVDPNVVAQKLAASQPAAPPAPPAPQMPTVPSQPAPTQPISSHQNPPSSHPSASSSRPVLPQASNSHAPSILDGNPTVKVTTGSRFAPPVNAMGGTPPVAPATSTSTQVTPVQNQTAAVAALINALPLDQRNTIVQLLSLTPEQINAMPPEGRARILEMRRTFLGPGA
ncbi:uncharacterized protein EI90DRAFT_3285375 [Cantharellus anzutake]|uniref:uncharacterized protein n=1 Tax=Cantharellus anzutake TaxID=1750568 RepID=UPI00190564BC|nr:uncharacterized protein EI90DRAFT_3285375 [Cantharellus anzutake]KAF8342305.1 hypothetical protein EI90DRAFT_3285375 [Cantharellus anzutake]